MLVILAQPPRVVILAQPESPYWPLPLSVLAVARSFFCPSHPPLFAIPQPICLSFRSAAEESASALAVACSSPLFVLRCHPERSLARTLRQTQSKAPDTARTPPTLHPFLPQKFRTCLCLCFWVRQAFRLGPRSEALNAGDLSPCGMPLFGDTAKTPANPHVKTLDAPKSP